MVGLILLANSWNVPSAVPTGLIRVCTSYVPAVNYWAIIGYPYGIKGVWIMGFSLMGENCVVEHAASLFARLDQRRERAGCTFYLANWKTCNWAIIGYPYGIKGVWIMSLSLMGENCIVEHAASLFVRLISVVNEQAARSTWLTGKLVTGLLSVIPMG